MRTRPGSLYGLIAIVAAGAYSCAYGVDPEGPSGVDATSSGSPASATGSSSSAMSAGGGSSSSNPSSSSSAQGSGGASGTGGAGSGASGGGGAAASSSAGGGGAPVGLSVEYKCAFTMPMGQEIKAVFNIKNNSGAQVALSDLKIRYYYTIDPGATTQSFYCDYAAIGCANVNGTFGMVNGTNTDHYVEVGFAGAGMLAPQAETGEVQSRFNKTDYSVCDQTNDYSFDPTKTAFTTWDHVTLYHQGALAWGVEP